MKGKRVLWYSLIMMLFISMAMVDIGIGQNSTRLYVDPEEIEGVNPCCVSFDIEIKIEDVEDLFCYSVTLHYAPQVQVLAPIEVKEGPFLKQGGDTAFAYTINHIKGMVTAGCSLLLPGVQGVTGSGTLLTIKFIVAEAGESPLNLIDTALINSKLEPIQHDTDHGYYKGPRVDLVNVDCKHELKVSEMQTLNATVRKRSESCEHEPDEPSLWTFVMFDMIRLEDGTTITLTTDVCKIVKGTPFIFDPVEWYPEAGDVGTYACTARVYFSYYGTWFNSGRPEWTLMFTVIL